MATQLAIKKTQLSLQETLNNILVMLFQCVFKKPYGASRPSWYS